jgi:predicted nucleic acid-binding protein
MAWCFAEEATDMTRSVLNRLSELVDQAIVPSLWLYEVLNVTELAVRKGRITSDKASLFLDSLGELPIELESPAMPRMFGSVRRPATQFRLTAYDAAYLELKQRGPQVSGSCGFEGVGHK